jgi:hypothetical protein
MQLGVLRRPNLRETVFVQVEILIYFMLLFIEALFEQI